MKIVICTNPEVVGVDQEAANSRADALLAAFESQSGTVNDPLDCDYDSTYRNWRGGKYSKSHWISVAPGVVVQGASAMVYSQLVNMAEDVDEPVEDEDEGEEQEDN